jgi:glycosyltransferase involved in cell wall biosynthesis
MGKTIIMASMLGKPVVATKVQGIPSVVLDNETGILVPPKDSKKLAEAIFKLIEDKSLRLKLGENAKNWVNKIVDGYPQFSIEYMLYKLEKLYEEI